MAQRLRPRIVGMASKMSPPGTDATSFGEDVAQDTLLRMWTLRDRLDDYTSPEALGMVMARRRAIDLLKQEGGGGTKVDLEGVDAIEPTPSPDELMALRDLADHLRSVMASLPTVQQAVMRMRHVDGMEIDEIAEAISSTPGAIRTALSRARQAVRDMFNPDL